jgi:hypothetical protein
MPNTLQEKKELLLEEKKRLVCELKDKYPKVYNWLISHKIDPNDLKKYAGGITLAFAASLGSVLNRPPAYLGTETLTNRELVKPLALADLLKVKNERDKVNSVWSRYGSVINDVSIRYNVDPKVILATIMVESGGNTYALRHEPQIGDASYGLGQLLYGTAHLIGFEGRSEELYIPEVNIDLIGKYHRRNLDVYGDLTPEQLTTAYNTGTPYGAPTYGHVAKFDKWFNLAKEVIS